MYDSNEKAFKNWDHSSSKMSASARVHSHIHFRDEAGGLLSPEQVELFIVRAGVGRVASEKWDLRQILRDKQGNKTLPPGSFLPALLR
jgi:hypothetical protein